jgi:hypothetical protein
MFHVSAWLTATNWSDVGLCSGSWTEISKVAFVGGGGMWQDFDTTKKALALMLDSTRQASRKLHPMLPPVSRSARRFWLIWIAYSVHISKLQILFVDFFFLLARGSFCLCGESLAFCDGGVLDVKGTRHQNKTHARWRWIDGAGIICRQVRVWVNDVILFDPVSRRQIFVYR